MVNQDSMSYQYHFTFEDNRKVDFEIKLNPQTLKYIPRDNQEIPEWAKFSYLPCEQCAQGRDMQDYCPIAVNIADVAEAFKDIKSYDVVDVTVETEARDFSKQRVPIQQALSSLLGIIMVTSGCDSLDKLRPMVLVHLPFATVQETTYRSTSMYLLAQYFRKKHGLEPDWDMNELRDIYIKIEEVNVNLCKRLREASTKDALMNAVVILDVFAKNLPMSIEEDLLEFDGIFFPYLS